MRYEKGQVLKTLFRIWCGDIGGLEAGSLFTITDYLGAEVERPYVCEFINGYVCEFKESEIDRLKDDFVCPIMALKLTEGLTVYKVVELEHIEDKPVRIRMYFTNSTFVDIRTNHVHSSLASNIKYTYIDC